MCGIGGVFAFDSAAPVDLSVLQRMCESLQHRGPDDDGIFIEEEGRIGLAHRRLSIIDLATGHQPMSNEAQTLWIVYNGEIYNSPELRRQLQRAGYRFATTSDTEVIIHLYDSMGEPAFTRLNGMFAFALYDRRNQTLVLARDIFGVKPLYYMVHEGRLLFGSEIKAILADRSVPRALDHEALDTFLTLRYSPSPQTLFKGIRKLPPGHLLRVTRSGSVTVEPYNLERPALDECISEAEATEEYDRLLGQAVERQLLADVPVGLLLSGGVDSAMLGYLMQRASSDTLKTFSIGFEGRGDYNELRDARETAEFIGADHHETTLTKTEYLAFYPRSFYYTEEPIAETTVPALWYVARLAASHLKVVLAGQGPDELLAGYRRYLGARYLNTFGPLIGNTPARALISLLPRNAALKRAAHAASFSDEFRRLHGILTIFTEEQKRELMNDATRKRARDSSEALTLTVAGW